MKHVKLIGEDFETEASGGINLYNIEDYAETGVDYVSAGALIHQARSLDLSLKAYLNHKNIDPYVKKEIKLRWNRFFNRS